MNMRKPLSATLTAAFVLCCYFSNTRKEDLYRNYIAAGNGKQIQKIEFV